MTRKTKIWLRRGYVVFALAVFVALLKLGHPEIALWALLGLGALGLPVAYFLKWR